MAQLIALNSNEKLGRDQDVLVGSFNIPAKRTCPGASERCLKKCYACRFRFNFPNNKKAALRRYKESLQGTFVDRAIKECYGPDIVRLHSSGDLYSPNYVNKWADIVEGCPRTAFGAYTRSWTAPGFRTALDRLNALPNMHLFLSVDPSMKHKPWDGYRHAYMVEQWIKIEGAFRCPNQVRKERGQSAVTCAKCMLCYRAPGKYPHVIFLEH